MIWRRRFVIFSLFWLTSTSGLWAADESSRSRPNIVYILADDLGYGDVQCLNPQRGKIKTPHLDRLASHGMTFTDAHSGSSVCTPTRYGLLTGRYAWRSRLQAGVLDGTDDPDLDCGVPDPAGLDGSADSIGQARFADTNGTFSEQSVVD